MTNSKFLVYWYNYKHKSTVYPIYLELKKRKLNVETRLYRPEEQTEEDLEKFKEVDYIITSSNCFQPYAMGFGNKIIWTWHGAGNALTEEGLSYARCLHYTKHKLNLMLGNIDYNIFKKKMDNLEIIGYPKLDNISPAKIDLKYDDTVLFVEQSHWCGKKGLQQVYTALVDSLVKSANKNKFNVMIRRYALEDTRFDKYKSDSIYILDKKDSTASYIKRADLIMCSLSGSNTYEAIGLDKPVIMYRPRKDDGGWLKFDDIFNCGFEINPNNLEEKLLETLNNKNMFLENRMKLKNKLFYKLDNKASKRAVDIILKRISE